MTLGDLADHLPEMRQMIRNARQRISTEQGRAVFSYRQQSDPLPNHQQTATTNQRDAGEGSDSEVLEQID